MLALRYATLTEFNNGGNMLPNHLEDLVVVALEAFLALVLVHNIRRGRL